MPYDGSNARFIPGREVPVQVVAAPDGSVAEFGEGVELVGENREYVEVRQVTAAGNGIGQLGTDPDDYDETATYAAGSVVGVADLTLWYPVFASTPAADVDPVTAGVQGLSVNDQVEFAAGGVVQLYDSADAAAPWGRVFRTLVDNPDLAGKVQVVRSGR